MRIRWPEKFPDAHTECPCPFVYCNRGNWTSGIAGERAHCPHADFCPNQGCHEGALKSPAKIALDDNTRLRPARHNYRELLAKDSEPIKTGRSSGGVTAAPSWSANFIKLIKAGSPALAHDYVNRPHHTRCEMPWLMAGIFNDCGVCGERPDDFPHLAWLNDDAIHVVIHFHFRIGAHFSLVFTLLDAVPDDELVRELSGIANDKPDSLPGAHGKLRRFEAHFINCGDRHGPSYGRRFSGRSVTCSGGRFHGHAPHVRHFSRAYGDRPYCDESVNRYQCTNLFRFHFLQPLTVQFNSVSGDMLSQHTDLSSGNAKRFPTKHQWAAAALPAERVSACLGWPNP